MFGSALKLGVLGVMLAGAAYSQGCRNWTDALIQGFLGNKAANVAGLKTFVAIGPEQFRSDLLASERETTRADVASSINHPTLPVLKSNLREFYRIGAELYGVELDANRLYVVPNLELNAFATGSQIFIHEGLLLYFSDPLEYLARTGKIPRNLTREQVAQVASVFNWRNDSASVLSVLAHEAGHNLMEHGSEQGLLAIRRQIDQFESNARSYREAHANGRSGVSLTSHIGQSILGFLSFSTRSRESIAQEEEADAVGAAILRRAGMNAQAGVVALTRMDRLYGPQARTWANAINSVFCSSHPDSSARVSSLQRQVGCLNSTGTLCEEHFALRLAARLDGLRSKFESIEKHIQETSDVAQGNAIPGQTAPRQIEIKPNPKDAALSIDGVLVTDLKPTLRMGRHVLTAAKEGYHPARIVFAVFPDVKSSVKFKLKKCDKRQACTAAEPESEESRN